MAPNDLQQAHPRWVGCWAEFGIARYGLLSKTKNSGDMQLFTRPA